MRIILIIILAFLFGCGPSSSDKKEAEKCFHEAKIWYEIESYDNSYERVSKAIELNYKKYEYYVLRGDIESLKGKYGCALNDYIESVKINKNNPIAYLKIANNYLKLGKEPDAVKYMNIALETFPLDPNVNKFAGLYFVNKKDYVLALKYLEEITGVEAYNLQVRLAIGESLVGIGKYEKAKTFLLKCIEEEGLDKVSKSKAYLFYAKTNIETGENNIIGPLLDSLENNAGIAGDIYNYAIQVVENYSTPGRLSLFEKLCEAGEKDSCDILNNIEQTCTSLQLYDEAEFLYQRGDKSLAIKFLEKSIKMDPNLGKSYIKLGDIYYSLSDEKKTRQCFEKAIQVYKENITAGKNLEESNYGIGYAYLKLDNFSMVVPQQIKLKEMGSKLAEKLLSEFDKLDNSKSYYEISKCFEEVGETELSEKFYKMSIEMVDKQYKQAIGHFNESYFSSEQLINNSFKYGYSLYQKYLKNGNEAIGRKGILLIKKACDMRDFEACINFEVIQTYIGNMPGEKKFVKNSVKNSNMEIYDSGVVDEVPKKNNLSPEYKKALSKADSYLGNKRYNEVIVTLKPYTDKGYKIAHAYVGDAYRLMGEYEKAFDNYLKGSESHRAVYGLGVCYYFGFGGVNKDISKAAEYFKKAADNGSRIAMNELGKMYHFGKDLPKNDKLAFEYWVKASKMKYRPALKNLCRYSPLEYFIDTELENVCEQNGFLN